MIEFLPTSQLKVHDRNPRKISEEAFEKLKRDVAEDPEYFAVRPILCTPDFVVFAGNMRLRAAIALGLEKVPVAVLPFSEKNRKRMILDNVHRGEYDADILSSDYEVSELEDWGVDMAEFGVKNFAPAPPDTRLDETQKWVYTCPDCGKEHVFSKSDLKPYEPDNTGTQD